MQQLSVDYLLIGTGIAPLIAAKILTENHLNVAVFDPFKDFFTEDLELPFDPLWMNGYNALPTPEQWGKNHVDSVLKSLRPHFPGAVEVQDHLRVQERPKSTSTRISVSTDLPLIQSRARLWLLGWKKKEEDAEIEAILERAYLEASEKGFMSQWLEGLTATSRVPGMSKLQEDEGQVGLWIPGVTDVDVRRYRNGILDFMRERLPEDQVFCGATQFTWKNNRAQFVRKGLRHEIHWEKNCFVFSSAAVVEWFKGSAPESERKKLSQSSVWEEWTWISRDPVRPDVIAQIEDFFIFSAGILPRSQRDSLTDRPENLLSILRRIPSHSSETDSLPSRRPQINESMKNWRPFFFHFLGWKTATLRSYHQKKILTEFAQAPQVVSHRGLDWVSPADGPLFSVVEATRHLFEEFIHGKKKVHKG